MLKLGIIILIAIVQLSTQCDISDYGLHLPATFEDAVRTCALQGSQLIVPMDQGEMRFATVDLNWGLSHWLGIHNLIDQSRFMTLNNGEHFEENDILKWKEGFPNTDESQNCVCTDSDGLIHESCDKSNRFICKKASFGRTPVAKTVNVNFDQAVISCALEGGQLMSPQNSEELSNMAFIAGLLDNTLWLGIHNLNEDNNFIDLNGELVFPSEFLEWEEGSPSLDDTSKNCVEIINNRLIRHVSCDKTQRYLCIK